MQDRVDALVFDLGRVVIDIDFERAVARWAAHAGCDPQRIRARFSPDAAFHRHERGEIDGEAYFAELSRSLGVDLTHAQMLDGWNAIFVGEMPGMAELLADAARRIPLYALTNSNREHELYWSRRFAGILRHFREIYVSSTIGLRKPDADIYRHTVGAIGIPAQRIVFFDDNLENIEGARVCGLQTVHVTSIADVAGALTRLLP